MSLLPSDYYQMISPHTNHWEKFYIKTGELVSERRCKPYKNIKILLKKGFFFGDYGTEWRLVSPGQVVVDKVVKEISVPPEILTLFFTLVFILLHETYKPI